MKQKNIPKIFGYPLWEGKIKRRVALKYLRQRQNYSNVLRYLDAANFSIGSVINDCSGFNNKIIQIDPDYRRVTGQGYILCNIDFMTEGTGCSLNHCGIEINISQEEVENRYLESTLNDNFLEDWYRDNLNDPMYLAAKAMRDKRIAALQSGKHITDENGCLLDEFREYRNKL